MTAHVRFENVSVRFGSHDALRNVSAEIHRGHLAAIIGPNGSGKSTLLNLLTGHHAAYSGEITVDGVDIARLRGADRAQKIGVLRQDSGPLPDVTVAELVSLGPRTLDRSAVEQALDRVGLSALADHPLPSLSGGQTQRALLARAIRHRPSLLVLDEPTNHLDVEHRIAILDMVEDMGITVVCALHDIDLANQYADDVLVLAAGRLHTQGSVTHTITREVLREVFHVNGESVITAAGARHIILSRLD
ncbi:ABC transporter ATP-binding protein [Agreia sp. VKM Ac-1783]|uniref:ABC transporter ATP-binding protein n=1 Tax=Agreia sp. VKM Ac-1783 TaxID=1938889 RepID=UPI000A2ACA65|nr:ABC transporter ATP-binding protein [Agreia sp. VKM Ac-1783]SMQ57703.1 iron complex transport system ATP-binding protein [Agreia sp. VKM Ac-1783]